MSNGNQNTQKLTKLLEIGSCLTAYWKLFHTCLYLHKQAWFYTLLIFGARVKLNIQLTEIGSKVKPTHLNMF